MTHRTLALMVLALVMGLFTSTVVYFQLTRSVPPLPVDKVAVVVALRDLPARTRTSAEDFTLREFPKDSLPPRAMLSIDEAVDRTARVEIKEGDPILGVLLTERGEDRVGDLIPEGMRAFSIRVVDSSTIVEGLIRPGSKVDVCLSMRTNEADDRKENGGAIARTLLENVEILAVGKQVEAHQKDKNGLEKARSITVVVKPRDANQLALAQNHGALHLTLRGTKGDKAQTVGDEKTDLRELKGEPVQASLPVPPVVIDRPVVVESAPVVSNLRPKPTHRVVELDEIRGNAKSQSRFSFQIEGVEMVSPAGQRVD